MNVSGDRHRAGVLIGFAALLIGAGPPDVAKDAPALRMTKPIICRKIHGFGDFEPMSDPKFTVDDKMTIYYEPDGYTIEPTKTGFRALLIQDVRLRKKGSKDAVWKKDKLFEYEAINKVRPHDIYMKVNISLKGLPPGEYELDLTLHDGLAKETTLTKTVSFKIIPLPGSGTPEEKPAVPPDPPDEKPVDR